MLTDGKRGCQFNFLDRADFDMTLLWRRDDTLQTALERLNAIQADPAAGRASRDAMLPSSKDWIGGCRSPIVKRYPAR
jgi:hypothetical protein